MNSIQVNQVLAQMRVLASQAQGIDTNAISGGIPGAMADSQKAGKTSFSDLLKNSINSVNEIQKTAGALKTSFEVGDPDVELSDVMVAIQKSNIAFTATVEVRNRLVEAYKDIMNMPV